MRERMMVEKRLKKIIEKASARMPLTKEDCIYLLSSLRNLSLRA